MGRPNTGPPDHPGIFIPPGREKAPLAHKTNTLMLKEKCTAYLAGGGVYKRDLARLLPRSAKREWCCPPIEKKAMVSQNARHTTAGAELF